MKKPRLLVISYRFPPQKYPLTSRLRFFLKHLSRSYDIEAVTAAENAALEGIKIHHVPPPSFSHFPDFLKRSRLRRVVDHFIWPDTFVPWIIPSVKKGREVITHNKIDAIAVFMMPYSPGVAGVFLKKWTGLPLILNFNDSPTCSDTNASFASKFHRHLAHLLENWYIRNADSVIYVSKRNMERVISRQPAAHRDKFHLIRRGALQPDRSTYAASEDKSVFRIVYTGGMSGWYWFIDQSNDSSFRLLKGLRKRMEHRVTMLDGRTHSPVYIGKAIRQVVDRHPEWDGRIKLELIGNKVDITIVNEVLEKFGIQHLVEVHEPIPHSEAIQKAANSDLLFLTLPDRPDGSPGGRISAKTYEYLMTDRPILAALPDGENRDYVQGHNGVYLTAPSDVEAMAKVVERLATSFFEGRSLRVERPDTWSEIQHTNRAESFENVVEDVLREVDPE